MKKVLEVNYQMNLGGIETFMMNIFNNLDHENYQITFLCYKKGFNYYEEYITKMGSKIIYIDSPEEVGLFKFYKEIKKVLRQEHFDIIHTHNYISGSIFLMAAFFTKVKKRIIHSHTTTKPRNFLQKFKWFFLKALILLFATDKLACSKAAGKSLFWGDFKVIPNGIDINKFLFNVTFRDEIRSCFAIKNEDVLVGHVGRFDNIKNQEYIIELANTLKNNPNFKFMLVGDGPNFNNVKLLAEKYYLNDSVIFIGATEDSYKYYNAFDLFILPSRYEGLGIVLIEAQANGLPCLVNTSIPREVNLSEEINFSDLNLEIWKTKISKFNKKENRLINRDLLLSYDIKEVIRFVEYIYMK